MQRNASAHNPSRHKNVSSYLDRHGVRRWRFRKNGDVYQLGTDYDGPDFKLALEYAQQGKRYRRSDQGTKSTLIPGDKLATALRQWEVKPCNRALTGGARSTHSAAVGKLIEYFEDMTVRELSVDNIRDIMTEHSDNPDAANRALGVLRRALEDSVVGGSIPANPAASVTRWDVGAPSVCYTWPERENDVPRSRRVIASEKRIESIIRAGLANGLTPSSVTQHADGSTVVSFRGMADGKPVKKKSTWDDI